MKKFRNGFMFAHVGWLKRMAFLPRPIKKKQGSESTFKKCTLTPVFVRRITGFDVRRAGHDLQHFTRS
jgi:hypothetical protein